MNGVVTPWADSSDERRGLACEKLWRVIIIFTTTTAFIVLIVLLRCWRWFVDSNVGTPDYMAPEIVFGEGHSEVRHCTGVNCASHDPPPPLLLAGVWLLVCGRHYVWNVGRLSSFLCWITGKSIDYLSTGVGLFFSIFFFVFTRGKLERNYEYGEIMSAYRWMLVNILTSCLLLRDVLIYIFCRCEWWCSRVYIEIIGIAKRTCANHRRS